MKNKIQRKVQGISFELDVLSAAKERARNRRQSLSAYINSLILPNVENNSQQKRRDEKSANCIADDDNREKIRQSRGNR